MNLDDLDRFKELDKQNMLAEIDGLPDQLQRAWELGQTLPLPAAHDEPFSRVVIAGMGGSAIGGDLLAAWSASLSAVPVIVHRDYGLPAFARGAETLVVASSHSGDTEETVDAFAAAVKNGCSIVAITTGGELARLARAQNAPTWIFEHHGQPWAAIGFSFGLLLALFARLKLIPDPTSDLAEARASNARFAGEVARGRARREESEPNAMRGSSWDAG